MKVGPLITIVFRLLFELIQLYTWVVLLACLFSFLIGFGILDPRERIVWKIYNFLSRMTEPLLQPIRNILPPVANIDLSPIALLLLIQYVLCPVLGKIYGMMLVGIA
ncbi:YggT family protein [Novacetimonas cocois]|uniref:YggT family protein n=2 Tax=Novacetimonas TaxID=2919364 RepID=A0A365YUA8_9PROT|nr:YggT family protein [Novacetimonas pomaceti]RBM05830.1 YggT family protein [Novacetimonas cocois]